MVRKVSKRIYKQRFYGNKKKGISINFFYNSLIFIIVCLGLFLVISIYFSAVDYVNRSQIVSEKKDMQFMFVDNNGVEHNISEESTEHGASSKWDYLFKDYTTGDIIGTGILNSGTIINTGIVKSGYTNEKIIVKTDIKKNTVEKTSDIPKKNCTTPRGKILEHGKSILAYQQRSDVPDICNIQRRICTDGNLGGTFEQKSCKTNMPYKYTKEPVISYNEKVIDPLIQPGKDVPINKGATFDNKGKIDGYSDADTLRNNYADSSSQTNDKIVDQTDIIRPNCISPWGDIVLNGQFIKAYRYKNGFSNHPCEVQIRPCMQGNLEGIYKNSSCKHRDIAFEDFMAGYFNNEQPSMQRIVETLNKDIPESDVIIKKGSIRETISNLRK
ncbi:MAG: hypothetical protein WAZ12_02675 [Candidatus Absconditicoccaceae bacterium]